jgi:DNA-binding NarL/FixJ family response regulator
VLRLLAAGRSNHAIARELVVTPGHRQKHVGYVLGKLGAASHTESVAPGPAY